MTTPEPCPCIAFAGHRKIASGALADVVAQAKQRLDAGEAAPVLLFNADGHPIEVDFRGSLDEVLARLAPAEAATAKQGPGRPRLGVVAREVTLLPRHWDWLATQPGGASVTLRRLVEEARRQEGGEGSSRIRQEAVHRFMTAMAGDLPGYEDALRALYGWDREKLVRQIAVWPADIREHVEAMVAAI